MRFLLVVLCACAPALAQKSPAPKPIPARWKGAGLAAKYVRDAGIGKDKRVVLTESFEQAELASRWDDVKRLPGTLVLERDKRLVHGGRQSLRVTRTRGKDTGGHLYKMLKPGHDRLFFRFYVRFPKGHGYVHHFVHLTGYNPATRWPQGGAGQRPAGNKRFSTGIDLTGDWGKVPPPGRWMFYSYWCEMAKSRDGNYWGNEPPGVQKIRAAFDRWTCVELMLKCNTIGKADGEQAFWIDGRCAGHWTGYRWRTDAALKVNGVWLLYYVTDNAAKQNSVTPKAKQHVLFDDVVVATAYIGPVRKK